MPVPEYLKDFIVDMNSTDKIDQLTVKGLSLLMGIFAYEENSDNQPVIAGSIMSLMHLVSLIDDSFAGAEITVIFTPEINDQDHWKQALGKKRYGRDFSSFHKTTFTLRKKDDQLIEVFHLDGIASNEDYIKIPNKLIMQALRAHAHKKHKICTKLLSYEPYFPDNSEVPPDKVFDGRQYIYLMPKFARQENTYICGVYAIKDARLLTRSFQPQLKGEQSLVETEFGEYHYQSFVVPAAVMRSSQSAAALQHLKAADANLSINRAGVTLTAFLAKYPQAGDYINKFGIKYLSKVQVFLEKVDSEQIANMMARFNCENFTQDDIVRINQARHDYQTKIELRLS